MLSPRPISYRQLHYPTLNGESTGSTHTQVHTSHRFFNGFISAYKWRSLLGPKSPMGPVRRRLPFEQMADDEGRIQ